MNIVYRTHPGEGQKPRPPWYSKWNCLANLLRVFGPEHQYHFMVDCADNDYLLQLKSMANAVGIEPVFNNFQSVNNANAFRIALDYACTLDGLLYLCEDDYLHRPGAARVLDEGVRGVDRTVGYATCYDHPDKYLPRAFTRLHLGGCCHWREVRSTTGTFAVMAEMLREDRDIWERYSTDECGWARDHAAFMEITERRMLLSSVPAYSTHCESAFLAPLVDWAEVNCQ